MMKILSVFAIALQLILCVNAFAFEPPRESIQEALEKGKSAFLARAIKTEQIDRKKYEVTAEVTLELQYCIYGIRCEKGEVIRMKYLAQTIKESTLPVQFSLGKDIVFILSHDLKQDSHFDSEWPGGIDRAFFCDNYPHDFQNSSEKVRCLNIYGGKKPSWVRWEELIVPLK